MNEVEQLAFFASDELTGLLQLVAAQAGLGEVDVRVLDLQHRPGAGVSGIYEIRGESAVSYLGATAEDIGTPPGTVRMSSAAGEVTVWQHPADPRLPGLPLATDPAAVERTWGGGRRLTALETLAYRPLRRAVLRASFGDEQVFIKVLRKDAGLLHQKHLLIRDAAIPAPEPVGEPVDELLAIRRVDGVPLAEGLMHEPRIPLAPERLVATIDALPKALLRMPTRPSWTDRIDSYASAAVTALPEQADRIRAILRRIHDQLARYERGPRIPTHGDLYEANIFVDDGRVSGLLDIDNAGPGHLVDELACFIAHLAVLPGIDPRYHRVPGYLETYQRHFMDVLDERSVTPAGLLTRAAAVALTLVAGARTLTGPDWRGQAHGRLEVVETLLDQAAAS